MLLILRNFTRIPKIFSLKLFLFYPLQKICEDIKKNKRKILTCGARGKRCQQQQSCNKSEAYFYLLAEGDYLLRVPLSNLRLPYQAQKRNNISTYSTTTSLKLNGIDDEHFISQLTYNDHDYIEQYTTNNFYKNRPLFSLISHPSLSSSSLSDADPLSLSYLFRLTIRNVNFDTNKMFAQLFTLKEMIMHGVNSAYMLYHHEFKSNCFIDGYPAQVLSTIGIDSSHTYGYYMDNDTGSLLRLTDYFFDVNNKETYSISFINNYLR